jgi:CheY-like chemotaxis protein
MATVGHEECTYHAVAMKSSLDSAGTRQAERHRTRVLLAEDRLDTSRLIRAFLNRRAYEVDESEDGESAIRAFAAGDYDLVVMDIGLPGIDGYSAIRRIREWERTHHLAPTPIIALTSYRGKDDIAKCLEAGANLHISKPFKRTTLLEFVRWALRNRKGVSQDKAGPVVIEVPSNREARTSSRIRQMRETVQSVQKLLRSTDYEGIKDAIARLIEQSGDGLEVFDFATNLARGMEQAASRREPQDIESLASLLSDYLDRVSVVPEKAER